MRRCTRCVIPDTRPDTFFDAEGICSACRSYEKRPSIDWRARLVELKALIAKHDGRVIVPSSGGKDSTYQVLRLIELGARPTVVTATTCHLTQIGRANIDNLARFATTIEVSPNKTVRAKLNRIALRLVGDISWPEHVSIHRVPFRVARHIGIPLIVYGECGPATYGGPPGSDGIRAMTQKFVSEFGGFLGLRAEDFVGIDDITERDMEDYLAPSDEELEASGIEAIFLGGFEEWDSDRNARVAIEHGFQCKLPSQANWWISENQDNVQVSCHDFIMYLKYGYGRLAAQVSVDIRKGTITREAAMELVEQRDGLFPLVYLGVPLARTLANIDVSSDEFVSICNQFLNRDIFASDVRWGERPRMHDEQGEVGRHVWQLRVVS